MQNPLLTRGHCIERRTDTPSIVLVVDDYTPMRTLVSQVLTQQGYEVWLADSGKAALSMLMEAEGCVDLLLLDVRIPDIDGFTIASMVRLAWSSIPIVFMSGHDSSPAFQVQHALGSYPFLKKPFTRHDLVTLLRSITRCISLRTKPIAVS